MTVQEKKYVYEVALYSVKSEEVKNYNEVYQEAIKAIQNLDGYDSYNHYKSLHTEGLYLDVVKWTNLGDAENAAEVFKTSLKFEKMRNAIDTIRYFDHLELLEGGEIISKKMEETDVFEFALFHIDKNSLEKLIKARVPLFNHISNCYSGFKQVITLNSISDPTTVLDLGIWGDAKVCHTAQKELESEEIFAPFAETMDMNKELVMEFFEKV